MKSYFGGYCYDDSQLHMVEYFDGQHIRQVEVRTYNGKIIWTEKTVTGALENAMDWKTAKRRLAALEKKATQRIG